MMMMMMMMVVEFVVMACAFTKWDAERVVVQGLYCRSKEAIGLGKVMSNKGGVAISICIDELHQIVFLNAHLAAHLGKQ